MWEALQKFAQGGLYEAMLRDLQPSHPNHDWLCTDQEKIPDFCKTVLDGVIPQMIHENWSEKGELKVIMLRKISS